MCYALDKDLGSSGITEGIKCWLHVLMVSYTESENLLFPHKLMPGPSTTCLWGTVTYHYYRHRSASEHSLVPMCARAVPRVHVVKWFTAGVRYCHLMFHPCRVSDSADILMSSCLQWTLARAHVCACVPLCACREMVHGWCTVLSPNVSSLSCQRFRWHSHEFMFTVLWFYVFLCS